MSRGKREQAGAGKQNEGRRRRDAAATPARPDAVGGAEQALRISEERLRLATQTGKIGVWDWDVAADRVSWTESLYAIHGVGPEQFAGTVDAFAALVHPDDRAFVSAEIERSLAQGTSYDVEFRAVRPDGGVIWLFTSAVVVREGDRPIRMLGATVDITERKQAQLALQESEERFAKAFNASPLSLTISSLVTGKLVEVNETFVRASGHSRDEAIGKTTVELGLWAELTDRAEELDTVRRSGQVRNAEYRFRARNGEEIVGILSAERIDIGGEPCTLTVIQDITDRKRIETAQRKQNERLRLLTEAAGDLLAAEDAAKMVRGLFERVRDHLQVDLYFNFVVDPAGKGLALVSCGGVGDEIAAAISHLDFGKGVDGTVAFERRSWIVTGVQESDDPRLELIRSLGVRVYASNPLLAGERLLGTLSFASRTRDAFDGDELELIRTLCHYVAAGFERVRLIGQLRDADRRKDQFLATLAHELRNPLAPIRNAMQVMRLGGGDEQALEPARAIMERQLQQMVRLIDDLLDLSRISRGKVELRKRPVELAAVLQAALETSGPVMDHRGHELTVDVPEEAIVVEADMTRLAQVFSNLLNNAAKYTDRGGRIELRVRRVDDDVVVSVRDNGVGIPAHMLPQVFDMFTQVDRPWERSQGGLGIGLCIVKQMVELHGGTVEAHSAGHGLGSEFRVHLPVPRATLGEREHTADDEAAPAHRTTRRRILVADDNSDSATSMAMFLEMLGNEVRTAQHGGEAIELVPLFRPDVILLDIGMPQVNGYDACRRIRQEPEGEKIFVIAVTGWGHLDDRRRSAEAGFDLHLVKPVNLAELEAALVEADRRACRGARDLRPSGGQG